MCPLFSGPQGRCLHHGISLKVAIPCAFTLYLCCNRLSKKRLAIPDMRSELAQCYLPNWTTLASFFHDGINIFHACVGMKHLFLHMTPMLLTISENTG
jgi:hypothetical protein